MPAIGATLTSMNGDMVGINLNADGKGNNSVEEIVNQLDQRWS